MSFGITSILASFDELDQCLMQTYYDPLLINCIRQSVKKELHQLDHVFYGCGFPHPSIKCFIAQLNKLLTNYGCNLGLGIHMQTSMELMIIRGGVSSQLLSMPYQRYSKWVTHSWLQLVWEIIDIFNLQVEVVEVPLKPPCQGHDNWLMLILEHTGFTDNELNRLY